MENIKTYNIFISTKDEINSLIVDLINKLSDIKNKTLDSNKILTISQLLDNGILDSNYVTKVANNFKEILDKETDINVILDNETYEVLKDTKNVNILSLTNFVQNLKTK